MSAVKLLVLAFGAGQLFLGWDLHHVIVFSLSLVFYVVISLLEYIQSKQATSDDVVNLSARIRDEHNDVVSLHNLLGDMQVKVEALEKAQATVKTMAEDSKKMLSQASLGLGFRAVKREG